MTANPKVTKPKVTKPKVTKPKSFSRPCTWCKGSGVEPEGHTHVDDLKAEVRELKAALIKARTEIKPLQSRAQAMEGMLREILDRVAMHEFRVRKIRAMLSPPVAPAPEPESQCPHGYSSCSACRACIQMGRTVEFEPDDTDNPYAI